MQKLGLASFLHRLIVKDIMPFDYFKTSDLVIYDEGIIHNVSIFGDEIIAKRIYEEHSTYGTNLIPAGVVYCFTSLEENLRRRNLRICQNKGTMLERNLDVDERRLLSTQSLELAQNKIAILKSLNINVPELDMENSIECNAKLATEYIKSFL